VLACRSEDQRDEAERDSDAEDDLAEAAELASDLVGDAMGSWQWPSGHGRRNVVLDRPARHIFLIATYRRTSGSDLTAITPSPAPAAAMVIAVMYPSVASLFSCSSADPRPARLMSSIRGRRRLRWRLRRGSPPACGDRRCKRSVVNSNYFLTVAGSSGGDTL